MEQPLRGGNLQPAPSFKRPKAIPNLSGCRDACGLPESLPGRVGFGLPEGLPGRVGSGRGQVPAFDPCTEPCRGDPGGIELVYPVQNVSCWEMSNQYLLRFVTGEAHVNGMGKG